jgi:ribonuclease BN (tRNA processing enzyme)
MENPDELDVLWISHFHGDHFIGVPALLLRFWEMKREKPLTILGQKGIEPLIHRTMNLAYPGFMNKIGYPLEFVEVEPEKPVKVFGLEWHSAESRHSLRNLAVRIDDGNRSVFYSGDGAPTPETLAMAQGCDLIVHEAFELEHVTPGHGTIQGCIDFARQTSVPTLALVHVQRDVRRERYQEILAVLEAVDDLRVLLPEPEDVLEL